MDNNFIIDKIIKTCIQKADFKQFDFYIDTRKLFKGMVGRIQKNINLNYFSTLFLQKNSKNIKFLMCKPLWNHYCNSQKQNNIFSDDVIDTQTYSYDTNTSYLQNNNNFSDFNNSTLIICKKYLHDTNETNQKLSINLDYFNNLLENKLIRNFNSSDSLNYTLSGKDVFSSKMIIVVVICILFFFLFIICLKYISKIIYIKYNNIKNTENLITDLNNTNLNFKVNKKNLKYNINNNQNESHVCDNNFQECKSKYFQRNNYQKYNLFDQQYHLVSNIYEEINLIRKYNLSKKILKLDKFYVKKSYLFKKKPYGLIKRNFKKNKFIKNFKHIILKITEQENDTNESLLYDYTYNKKNKFF